MTATVIQRLNVDLWDEFDPLVRETDARWRQTTGTEQAKMDAYMDYVLPFWDLRGRDGQVNVILCRVEITVKDPRCILNDCIYIPF